MDKFIHTTPLSVPCRPLCVLTQLCPVSSHSRPSVPEPIVKHPRLETQHPPWEMTQSGRIWTKEEPDCATDNYRSLESGLSVGLPSGRRLPSSQFSFVCPGLPWYALVCSGVLWDPGVPWRALVCPGGTRRLLHLIPILHAPNVPVSLPRSLALASSSDPRVCRPRRRCQYVTSRLNRPPVILPRATLVHIIIMPLNRWLLNV